MTTRADVEYQLEGLEQELRDGLARLERADAADDHVAFYRRGFDRYVADLRRELDNPTPNIHTIAVAAMQAAWLARIWPVLQSTRLQWRGSGNLKDTNTKRTATAATTRRRCLAIARTMLRPTPAAIRAHYQEQFPSANPAATPSTRTISRYLAPEKK